MNEKPTAITRFEAEALSAFDTGSFILEHPIERLIYHIESSGGRVIDSHFDTDGKAMVTWESKDATYRAWSTWPGEHYKVDWKKVPQQ
jgi:hypothetical protein